MYINTDTTAADVLVKLVDSLNRKVNSINNGIVTHGRHSTYVTRGMLRDSAIELKGMWGMYVEAKGYELTDDENVALTERVQGAIANVAAMYPKKK